MAGLHVLGTNRRSAKKLGIPCLHLQAKLYPRILAAMKPGATLGLSHGFLLGVMRNDHVDFSELIAWVYLDMHMVHLADCSQLDATAILCRGAPPTFELTVILCVAAYREGHQRGAGCTQGGLLSRLQAVC